MKTYPKTPCPSSVKIGRRTVRVFDCRYSWEKGEEERDYSAFPRLDFPFTRECKDEAWIRSELGLKTRLFTVACRSGRDYRTEPDLEQKITEFANDKFHRRKHKAIVGVGVYNFGISLFEVDPSRQW